MIGYVLVFLGFSMSFSAIWSYIDKSSDLYSIMFSFLITSSFGFTLILLTQISFKRIFPFISLKVTEKRDLSHKDGYTLVTLSWILMAIFSALPYYIYGGPFVNYVDAFFESISGLTGTGFSTFKNIRYLDPTLILWRSSSQWIGGLYFLFSIILLIDIFDNSFKKSLTNFISFNKAETLKQS